MPGGITTSINNGCNSTVHPTVDPLASSTDPTAETVPDNYVAATPQIMTAPATDVGGSSLFRAPESDIGHFSRQRVYIPNQQQLKFVVRPNRSYLEGTRAAVTHRPSMHLALLIFTIYHVAAEHTGGSELFLPFPKDDGLRRYSEVDLASVRSRLSPLLLSFRGCCLLLYHFETIVIGVRAPNSE